jgi:nucleoid DNA-binding protein
MEIPNSISKLIFWRYVNKKIKRSINHYHVLSVITILFEEMLIDLKQGKEIKIFNLGTLTLGLTKPRKYYDVRFQKVMQSEGHKILRFILAPTLSKKLRALLDIDRTFEGD